MNDYLFIYFTNNYQQITITSHLHKPKERMVFHAALPQMLARLLRWTLKHVHVLVILHT